ncbi:Subtilisin-like serine endopeptidase family protein [Euphorbia peplus]|nr:Subtilisin-like serine endopeptidase family protein [Euphorbia peplus]
MASSPLQLLLLFLPFFLISFTSSTQIPQHYVVYMGSSSNGKTEEGIVSESAHLQLLSSIIPSEESERISVIHHYNHAFNGFSAMLTENEASVLSGYEGVVSVFKDPTLKLHTTRSWDFLEANFGMQNTHQTRYPHLPSDIIIGMIDTGIWPESPSFSDKGIGEIPSRWKGTCMEAHDFKKSNCNRKLIGARYYEDINQSTKKSNKTHMTKTNGSPRDYIGHGTHTTSIASGSIVANTSYYGLAKGRARGGSPRARIAAYKACTLDGCAGSTILKAIEDAIKDGVDIISISIGMDSFFQPDYLNDPIAIGSFHAQEFGVLVVASGGNDGPDAFTVVNSAPWIFTVAASSIDRDFESRVVLGNGKFFQGSAINFSNLTSSKTYPIAFGENVASNFTPASEARNCYPGSLDRNKVAGKIVICIDSDFSIPRRIKKLVVEDAGAKGLILINEYLKGVPFDSGVFPFSEIGNSDGSLLLKYINSTKKPSATILASSDILHYKPAPVVAYFSSRGPAQLTENILKPDIVAPGVAILAAMIPENEPGSVPNGKKPSGYATRSGTSMACPHVAGAAAFIKSVHHGWTSSMIRSALMTTATIRDNLGKPLKNSSNSNSNPHEIGAGEINPIKALNPGLVFQTTTNDYLQFLCFYGYSQKKLRSMSNNKNFNCPPKRSENQISDVNYASISIGKLDRHQPSITIRRTLTNVGPPNSTYIAKIEAPQGLFVKVFPKTLWFGEKLSKLTFKVNFDGKLANHGYNFGSVTWFDGKHYVRLVFSVNVLNNDKKMR